MNDDMTMAVINFFETEIENGKHDGVNPATLASAVESLLQAPEDVIISWCMDGAVYDADSVKAFVDHVARMQVIYGSDVMLKEMLDEHVIKEFFKELRS